ncbi:MAG: excisionase family DNA binding protein [Glaciecola sp.]|jgi:excisionase family DNA binding protein
MFEIKSAKETYFTSKQAASLLEVTTRTIQLWSESGILQASKTAGGHRRFNVTDIEMFKEQLKKTNKDSIQQSLVRVLVIEDEPDLVMLYKMTIKEWNLPIILDTATDGFEGLIKIGAWKPNIVIADLQMPNMNGIYMLKALSKIGIFKEIMVMAVSGLSPGAIEHKGGLPKEIRLFSKPIPFDEIEKAVNQHCKKLLL